MGKLDDLRKACREATSATERIERANRVLVVGQPAPAEKGALALRMKNRTVTFLEEDVLETSKLGDLGYRVWIKPDAMVEISVSQRKRASDRSRCSGCGPSSGPAVAMQAPQEETTNRESECTQHASDTLSAASEEKPDMSEGEAEQTFKNAFDTCMSIYEIWGDLARWAPGFPPPPGHAPWPPRPDGIPSGVNVFYDRPVPRPWWWR